MTNPQDREHPLPLFAEDHLTNPDRLFEQYKMLVQSADAVSDRRARTHGLFLTINAGLLAIFGATVERFPWYTSLLILIAGMLVALSWASLIDGYRTLNTAKFKIIHEVEQHLPLRMFAHEWVLLKQGDGTLHKPLSRVEKNIPFIIMALYGVLTLLLLAGSFQSPSVVPSEPPPRSYPSSETEMSIPIFLSLPQPHQKMQCEFVAELQRQLVDRRLSPRTLGVTDYSNATPLETVRALMTECCGVVVVGLRRHWIELGSSNHNSDIATRPAIPLQEVWLTSPWCQIEAAMGFQLGLPLLVLRESGVVGEGVFQPGVGDFYLPEFRIIDGTGDMYLEGEEWKQIYSDWESEVRAVRRSRGRPPRHW